MSDPRTDIGLTAAEGGDVHGAAVFVRFIHRELAALQVTSQLPDVIRARLGELGREANGLAEFLDGYCEACSFDPSPPDEAPAPNGRAED